MRLDALYGSCIGLIPIGYVYGSLRIVFRHRGIDHYYTYLFSLMTLFYLLNPADCYAYTKDEQKKTLKFVVWACGCLSQLK